MRTQDLPLLRLVAQRLAGPRAATPAEAVARLGAAQGQDPAGARVSVAMRTVGGGASGVDEVVAAMDAGEVVTTWPMRGTMHLVAAGDVRWLLRLGAARVEAAGGRRDAELGLTAEDVVRARALAEEALANGRRLGRAELMAVWEAGGLSTAGQRGYHLVRHLAHTGVLVLGPVSGSRQQFVLTEEWLGPAAEEPREAAVDRLVLRYFAGHGPATVADLVRWAGVTVRDVRAGLARVGDRLLRVEVGGEAYWLDPEVSDLLAAHRREARGLFLLPGFDEFVLGYADRSAFLAAGDLERVVPGRNGVFRPTIVWGGRVVGTWRHVGAGAARRVEAEPFGELPVAAARALAGEGC